MKVMLTALVVVFLIYTIIQSAYSLYYFRKARILSKKTFTGIRQIKNDKPLLKVFAGGDSIGAGVGASKEETSVFGQVFNYLSQDHSLTFENASVPGYKMANLLPLDPPKDQDFIILIISSNDVFRFTSLDQFKNDTEMVLRKYSKVGKKVIIVGPARLWEASAVPIPLRIIYKFKVGGYAKIISILAKNYENVIHLTPINPPPNLPEYGYTLASDRFHPNDEGHKSWFEIIKTAL